MFSLVDLCVPGATGASGAFPHVAPLVHNGSAIWLSSPFSEKFSDSGRSNVEVVVQDCLVKNVLENSQP